MLSAIEIEPSPAARPWTSTRPRAVASVFTLPSAWDTPNGGHRRKARPVDGSGANRHPQRAGRRDDIDAGAADFDRPPRSTCRRIHLHERHASAGDPESVAEEREALRRRIAPFDDPEPRWRVRRRVDAEDRVVTVGHNPRLRPAEDHIGGPVSDRDPGDDLVRRRRDADDRRALVVSDPYRSGADPDV